MTVVVDVVAAVIQAGDAYLVTRRQDGVHLAGLWEFPGGKVARGAEDARQHDEECRIAYVAVTRARRRLVVVDEGSFSTPRMEVL
mgnify:CR=1 FL=1